jgi:hypothetical protein
MKRVLFIVCILSSLYAEAQKWPFELWHEGKIVLATGDTIKGLVKYDLQQDLLQYNDRKNNIEAYTARKVLFFEIFDNTVSRYRQFYALPFNSTPGYKAPVFFELLEEGKMTLLTRERLEYRTYSSPYYYGSYSRLVMIYSFYLLEENGNIVEFVGKKSDLLEKMGRKSEIVEKYMRENRLKIEEREDFARIVSYYNSLF